MKILNRTEAVVNTIFQMRSLYVKKGGPCKHK